jgi:hypothetical protein
MRGRPLLRALLVVVLLAAVGWQLVDYAAHEADHAVYPTSRELTGDFEQYHGDAIDQWVTVAERTDEGFRTTNGLTVRPTDGITLPDRLDAGDSVQVYGVARPGPTVEVRRVSLTDSTNRAYMLVVSAVGLLLALGATLRHWRPSLAAGYVLPRTDWTGGSDAAATNSTGGDDD